MLSYQRPGGEAPRAIELARDAEWEPPARQPWNSRARLAVAALVLAAATFVQISGLTQPTGLRPTFVLSGGLGGPEAVAVDSGLALVVRDGTATAYRLADGAVAWSRGLAGPAPTIIPLGDRRLLLSTLDASGTAALQVVEASTGAVDWTSAARFVGLAGAVAVVSEGQDGENAHQAGLDLATGRPLWTAAVPVWTTVARANAEPRLREQAELSAGGTLAVRDLTTGRIRARTDLPAGTMATLVAVANGAVVVETGAGSLYAYDAADLRPLWRRPTPLIGYFSQFVACGANICHINDRGTVALDRASGRTLWQVPTRYRAQTVDESHLFVAGYFHRSVDSTGGVLDPASGALIHELSPWAALETLDLVDGDELLVWRLDGQKRVVVGLFDPYTGRARVVGRTDPEFGTPACVAADGHVLCAGERDVVGWPA